MTTHAATTWSDIRAEMGRRKVSTLDIAKLIGLTYSRFSTILNADSETNPTPEFAERVMSAIREIAGEHAA